MYIYGAREEIQSNLKILTFDSPILYPNFTGVQILHTIKFWQKSFTSEILTFQSLNQEPEESLLKREGVDCVG